MIRVERRWQKRAKTHKQIQVTQGAYSWGSLSAGTHGGGGVLDLQTWHLSAHERTVLINVLRKHGAVAWYRSGPGWAGNEHIHLVLCAHRNAAPGAKAQIREWAAGGDGLVGPAADPHWRPKRPRRWSHRRRKIVYTDGWLD
jgi:hypothetical protein